MRREEEGREWDRRFLGVEANPSPNSNPNPQVTIWSGVFPIVVSRWAALGLTVYYVATNAVLYYVRRVRHVVRKRGRRGSRARPRPLPSLPTAPSSHSRRRPCSLPTCPTPSCGGRECKGWRVGREEEREERARAVTPPPFSPLSPQLPQGLRQGRRVRDGHGRYHVQDDAQGLEERGGRDEEEEEEEEESGGVGYIAFAFQKAPRKKNIF